MWPPLQTCVGWDGECVALRKTAVMKNSCFCKGSDIRERKTPGQKTGAVDLEATLQRKKEHYRRELQEQITEKQSHRRRDVRQNVHATLMSEASAYRKQPRDDVHLDTAEPPEGVLQYRTDPVSLCRMPFVPTQLPFLTDAYKTPNNDAESLLSPSRAYCPITGVCFSTSSGEPHALNPHSRSTYRQRILGENEVVGSGLLAFPAHHAKTDRLSYKEELRKQRSGPHKGGWTERRSEDWRQNLNPI